VTWGLWVAAGLALSCGGTSGGASAQGSQQISGVASYYGDNYKGLVASGARYDPDKFTAAHRTLPFGTHLHVTDSVTHRNVMVIVNDRGPFIEGRMLDLSLAAAKALRMTERGLIRITATMQ
jgi:rare lipoprotein A